MRCVISLRLCGKTSEDSWVNFIDSCGHVSITISSSSFNKTVFRCLHFRNFWFWFTNHQYLEDKLTITRRNIGQFWTEWQLLNIPCSKRNNFREFGSSKWWLLSKTLAQNVYSYYWFSYIVFNVNSENLVLQSGHS